MHKVDTKKVSYEYISNDFEPLHHFLQEAQQQPFLPYCKKMYRISDIRLHKCSAFDSA